MAPRTSWKGFLKLSLISIPVKAFTANETAEAIRLNQLHKDCHQRVRYLKVCPEHGELKATDIVSGYEFAKDEYAVIDPAEIAKLRPESDHAVKIHGFISDDELDPLYHAGKTYYLLPDGVAGDKPYALLHKGMADGSVVALAQVVIAGREQLVSLRPIGELIAVTVLHAHATVREPGQFEKELDDLEVSSEEVSLVETLIRASTLKDFDYARYKDQYVERMRELIRLKVEGREIVQAPEAEEPKILNLMDALKRSVAEAQARSEGGSDGGSDVHEKHMAPSTDSSKKKAPAKKAQAAGEGAEKKKRAPKGRKSG